LANGHRPNRCHARLWERADRTWFPDRRNRRPSAPVRACLHSGRYSPLL